jgi:hypothetical protein
MCLGDLPDDREAEPASFRRAAGASREPFEDLIPERGRDPRSVVLDDKRGFAARV